MRNIFLGFFFFFFSFPPFPFAEEAPHVKTFTPQGTVKNVRQVRASFSEQMVPFGEPRSLLNPFEIDCPGKGSGRWADGANWLYDFEKDLPAGVQCRFALKPGLQTLSGREISGPPAFSFSTGGPAVKSSVPAQGAENIDEEQIFILTLDAEPSRETVLENVFFSIEGLSDRVGIKLIEGRERQAILNARKRRHMHGEERESPLLLLQSKLKFPNEARVNLVWGKGVASQTGVPADEDQVLAFKSRKAFSADFRCERENARAACLPITPMTLNFSAPVARDSAKNIVLKGPGGKEWRSEIKDEENITFLQDLSFRAPFPEKADFQIVIPPGLKDDAGRLLVNGDKFPLAVRTDRYPPLAKFSSRFGILELKGDPALPVTLRNVEPRVKGRMVKVGKEEGVFGRVMGRFFNIPPEKGADVQGWLRRVASASREKSMFTHETGVADFQIPKPGGAHAFEVIGIPLKKPGLYIIELESAILGSALLDPPRPMFVPAAALVTNLSVHFKKGRESSLVWVTTLDKGEPVKGARITVRDCRESTLWEGETDGQGISKINTPLPFGKNLPRCDHSVDSHDYSQTGGLHLSDGYFVMAQTREDMSFVHSSWNEGIEPWRFQLPYEDYRGPVVAHTIFDRSLLRAGQTLHMKHILRQHTMKGFSQVPAARRPDTVSLQHYGSEQKYEFPLSWDGAGVAETTWSIPQNAKLGVYGVFLTRKAPQNGEGVTWQSGQFRVEEFRIPLLRGTIQGPTGPLVASREVPLDLNVRYLAGGPAGLLPVKLRGEVRTRAVPSFEGFDAFAFSTGAVREGLVRRGGEIEGEEEEDAGETPADARQPVKLPPQELTLDRSGSTRTVLTGLPEADSPKELLAEMEFKDPNGEVQTVSSRIPLWSSRLLVGVKPESWAASPEGLKFQTAVLNLSGKPVGGAKVKAELFQRKTLTHRKRLVGGFYSYENVEETRRVGGLCEGETDSRGLFICEARSPVFGNVIVQVESRDETGRPAITHTDVWVAEKEDWWFAVGDHDRIDLLPEKKRYEPGDTAVFQVRMPFREATALVSIEREGVIEAWVQKISGKKPTVEVPVKGSYAPNVFVSVLPVRGRVAEPKPTALVDLGRPAYKLGISEINVGWKEHELKVNLSTDRQVYRVRQKAKVRIGVKTWEGKIPPPGSEVALAAVDEGLLELMDNRSWKILPAMMGRRGYGVQTATAQGQVIGKRHFGLKALPQGGGGGRQTTRELFDTLLLWKGRLSLDGIGEAEVEVPLNDSITSFRIVAVATGGTGLFGTGSTSIQSTQDLMVLSGLPPLVREGDRFRAEFTLRNASARAMDVNLSARVAGLAQIIQPVSASLAPGEAKQIEWDVTVPFGVEALTWELQAAEKNSSEKDRIKVSQKVAPAVPVRTFQATLTQLDRETRVVVEPPSDALPGRGGVRVIPRPKLAETQSGIVEYMRKYPYGCLEQKISVSVALRNPKLWKDLMVQIPAYLDSDGLVKYFPSMRLGSEVLTSYLLAISHEAGWAIPPDVRKKMEGGLGKFIEGSIIRRSPLPTVDLALRKLAAMEALSRTGKFTEKMLGSISIEPNLWPTSAVIDWLNLLQNTTAMPDRDKRLRNAEMILHSRLNFQGTILGFSTEETDCLWWLMVSTDVNSVRAVLSSLRLDGWKEDIPRLVQGALARQKAGKWDLTLANAWGVLALEKFSRAFEAVPVTGVTQASLSGRAQTIDWTTSPKGKALSFPWPAKKEELAIAHQGDGKPWITVQSLAAIPLKEPFSSGYKIQKTFTPVQQKHAGTWTRGDIVRIRLDMEAQSDQTWVVVSDPVPAGSTILGSGLGRDSALLTQGEEQKGRAWPAFQERSFETFRAYYEYVPKGKWTIEYTVRLNQSGSFQLPTTRVEALYFPEMLGEIPNRSFEVRP